MAAYSQKLGVTKLTKMFGEFSRRQVLGTIAGGLAATQSRIVYGAEPTSLSATAAASGYVFGAAAGPVVFTDARYGDLYKTQTKIITTDIALKMSTVAPQPGLKRFESADRLLAFCDANKIPMRGHCLIWNEWVPAWIKSMSTEQRRGYMEAYIEEVMTRYAGKLQSWDVVNEPFWPGHKAPGGFRLGPWYDAFGPDYVRRAFLRAQQADPRTKLVLNEAQTERDDAVGLAVRQGLLKLVSDLKNAGVKLDAVGLQGHLQPQYPHDPARFHDFLHTLAGYGVDIYITEFDVRDDTFSDDIKTRDAQVAEVAKSFLANTLSIPAVKMVICWELADNYSFYKDVWKHRNPGSTRLPRPLPYDADYQRKPLWSAIAEAFEQKRG
jgi:endo-1,4-beta-xylanase